MALIAVLWIIAALSIIVTGMVQAVRNEIRVTSTARQMLEAVALGDAAIHLTLQELLLKPERSMRLQTVNQNYRGVSIAVQILPLNGLIDMNAASQELLERLFVIAGKTSPQAASALAQATIETRSQKDSRGRPQGFEASEDLLQVPGMGYALYANISPLITTDLRGNGRVNPMAAPLDVLVVLSEGSSERAAHIAELRDADAKGIDISSLTRVHLDENASTQRFRLQARVPLSDGRWVSRTRTIDLTPRPQGDQPWRIFRVEQHIETPLGKHN